MRHTGAEKIYRSVELCRWYDTWFVCGNFAWSQYWIWHRMGGMNACWYGA